MGGSKGGSSRTPVEAKETGRSFQILRILEVISEGEIYGLVDDMKSVYLDKTPLCNADGSFNFKNVNVYATAGTQSQSILNEFNSVEKEVDVGSKILFEKPITKTITDKNVTRVRMTVGVERLSRHEDNGDTNPSEVTFEITVLKNNAIHSNRIYTISGKYSNPYREMFYIEHLPQAPFQIKVARTNKESLSNKHQDAMFWGSYTEIIDEQFAYPNTALVGIKIDSEYFSNVPTRNYEVYGLIMKVPDIYNAFEHTYTSNFWNGEFKLSWTNNPAWVLYDLVTNTRYGMGMRLADFGIDKWQLYAIGRYCDELVPDGYGGTEPRMTCNAWITDQRKAYDLIMDLCSIFRGMPVWNGQALTAIQDRASDPVWTYNNSNVIGGFKRQRSARKARHNCIEVQYVDKDDFYEKKVESVSDDNLIARYGLNTKKITAFGCTSRGQAYRTGKWLLETEKLETETITFTVGQEGVMHLPYDIIEVADNEYAGTNVGGRILEVNGTQVKLDRSIEFDDRSYLSYVSGEGRTENVKIVRYDRDNNIVTLAKSVAGTPQYSVWALTNKRVSTGLYRAVSIKENDSKGGKTYTITALQHVPEKEDIVTNGTYFEPRKQTIYSEVTAIDVAYDGRKVVFNGKVAEQGNGLLSKNATSYTIRLVKDGALVYIKKGLKTPDLELDNLENGTYTTIISAYNEQGQLLSTKEKTFVIDRPPLVTEIEITPHFTSIWLNWAYVDDITQTEIWVNTVDNIKTAQLLATVNATRYSHEVGGEETRYYWFRHKRGINLGLFDQVQGRVATSQKDLKKQLAKLNEALKENVVEEIINVALPARKLEMVLTVERITDPTVFLNHKQVYNEADGKLWVWNKTTRRYEPDSKEVLASAIRGIIQPSQLASIPTTKIDGKITNEMLQSVNANKLAGVIDVARLPSIPTAKLSGNISKEQIRELEATKLLGTIPIANVPTIPTNKLTGLLTSSQIQSLDATKLSGTINLARLPSIPTTNLTGKISSDMLQSVSASKIDGTIDLGKIPSIPTTKLGGVLGLNQLPNLPTNKITGVFSTSQLPSIPTNKLTGTLTDAQLQGISASKITGTINVNQLASIPTTKLTGQIQANQLAVNSVGANVIQANAIGSQHIQANSIDAGKIRANAIGAEHINARSITGEKLLIGNFQNLIPNGALELGSKVGWANNLTYSTEDKPDNEYASVEFEARRYNILTQHYDFPVNNAEEYLFEVWVKSSEANHRIYIEARNSDNNAHAVADTLYLVNNFNITQANQWIKISNKIRFKNDVRSIYLARIFVNHQNGQTTNAQLKMSGMRLRQLNGGNLIVDGSISAEKVASNAIQTKHLTANAITAEKIQANAIGVNHLGANVVTAEKIQAGAVNAQKIATNAIEAGHIKANAIASNHIRSNAITADKILANAITSQKITANAITGLHLAVNAVKAVHITANSIETSKIKAGAVTASQIATNAVTAEKILARSIQAEKIASNAIQATHISANAVTANAIQAGAIGADKIQANSISASKMQANSIGANAIQANAVGADKIQANAITSAKIQAGAINANHISAGTISADKLAIGLGGNLLYNPIFANNGEGWHLYVDTGNMPSTGWSFNRSTGDYQGDAYLDTENQFRWQENRKNTNGGNVRLGGLYHDMKLAKGKYYIFSAYVGGHRAYIDLNIEHGTTEQIFKSWGTRRGATGGYGGGSTKQTGVEEERRIFIVFKANGNVDSNYRLIINMWAYGSEQNAFVAIRRPMLEECTVHARKPSAWVNAGVTSINGGSIKTRTITAQHLQANTITANEIASGSISAEKIRANAITSDKILAGAIRADKIRVDVLSAITSNLGHINGGSLNIANKFKVTNNGILTAVDGNFSGTITGATIRGTTINGGTIIGSRIEGLTIQAENIIGDVVKIYSSQLDSKNKVANIVIPSSPKRRKAYLLPVLAIASRSSENVYLGNDRDEWREYISDGNIIIKKNNTTILNKRIHIDRNGYKTVPISTSFEISPNQTTTISFIIENGGVFVKGQEFLFLVGNY